MSVHVRNAPPKVIVWTGATSDSVLVLDRDVVSLQASNSVTAPTGNFSFALVPRQSDDYASPASIRRLAFLYRTLRPNMIVSIGFEEQGGIMLGLIDRVTKVVGRTGGTVSYVLQVSGTGIGKVLVNDSVVRATLNVADYPGFSEKIAAALGAENPIIQDLPGVWGPQDRDGTPTFIGRSPKEVVDWLLDNTASMRLPLLAQATGGTGEPKDYMRTDKSVLTWHDGRVWSDGLTSFSGSVFSFLQQILDTDFYECRVDTVPNGAPIPEVHLIIRPKPFDEPDFEWAPVAEETGTTWNDLRTLVDGLENHDIDESEVLQEQLGVSDQEAFSYFSVTSPYDPIGSDAGQALGLFYPLVDTYTAKRNGLRQYSARMSLVGADVSRRSSGDDSYAQEVSAEVQEARNRLFNWYRANSFYENGSIQVVGRDRFRPGDPVRLAWQNPPIGVQKGLRYYCAAVSWSWQLGGHYTSTLQLTRGHNGDMMTEIAKLIAADAPATNPSHYAAL